MADITWGANTHFLKIEMDVNGGTNYSHMGTNQMMSVPYALYAENANINYDSISTLLSNDSTFITNVGGGVGGGGCDIKYPEGLDGEIVIVDLNFGVPYTVPLGKNLYITNVYMNGGGGTRNLLVDGKDIHNPQGSKQTKLNNPIIVSENSVVSTLYYGTSTINGILVDANILPVTIDFSNSNYVVPNDKKLFITNLYVEGNSNADVFVDNKEIYDGNTLLEKSMVSVMPIKTNSIISYSGIGIANFNGYLVDENYFADCGGGGSSTSTIDSSYIDSLVQFYSSGNGGGCDYKFPQGISKESLTLNITGSSNYTVPNSKRLYITNVFTSNGNLFIDNLHIVHEQNNNNDKTLVNPIIVDEGQVLSSNNSGANVHGFFVDVNSDIEIITMEVSNITSFIVPTNKILIVNNLLGYTTFRVNGIPISYNPNIDNTMSSLPLVLKSGDQLDNSTSSGYQFNGYLVDENYFADCGGGGGGSSSSTIDSSYIDSLVQFYSSGTGGGCDLKFPDGINGDPINFDGNSNDYTVPAGKTLYITVPHVASEDLILDGLIMISTSINSGSNATSFHNPLVVKEGEVISGTADFHGLLFENSLIEPITFQLNNWGIPTDYTVPTGKELYILNQYGQGGGELLIDGIELIEGANNNYWAMGQPIKIKEGQVVSTNSGAIVNFNGYLADENYFADCGGGGSSSSTIDSSYIDSLVQFYSSGSGGGCEHKFPDGLVGEPILWNFTNGNYIIPPGKNLYMLSSYGWSKDVIDISTGTVNYIGGIYSMPFVFNDNYEIFDSDNAGNFNGILVDANVAPILWNFTNGNYIIPPGKNLYMLSSYGWSKDVIDISTGTVNYIGGINIMPFVFNDNYEIFDADNAGNFNGYLVDENYFADCGGGSSSSTVDSSYIDSLVQFYSSGNGGGCDINLPEGIYGDPVIHDLHTSSYTVPAGKNLYLTNIYVFKDLEKLILMVLLLVEDIII